MSLVPMGVAYAIWYDTLTIEEQVTTGYVDVRWVNATTSDFGGNYQDWNGDVDSGHPNEFDQGKDRLDPDNPNERKNIGSLDATIDTTPNDTDGYDLVNLGDQTMVVSGYSEMLEVKLKNGYPGYQEKVMADVRNEGTVPVAFTIEVVEDVQNILYPNNPNGWLTVDYTLTEVGVGGNIPVDGYVLDPGDDVTVVIKYRILSNAPEDLENIVVKHRIVAKQWNAYNFDLPDEITTP